jgi:hypothetical protein
MSKKSLPPNTPRTEAQVLRLVPTINKPLSADSYEVVSKLKRALIPAQSGATVGALVVTVDKEGYWSTDLAGQMMYDREILSQIAFRLLGVCISVE